MELKYIESFIQVAELNSFTKAAEKLGYSQSTVSFQIRQLEESLGVPLFDRVNHTIKLTQKGGEILALAHQLIAVSHDMEKAAHGIHTLGGHIRVAMADSLCHSIIWDKFESFHRQYPAISLQITSASTEEMFRLLKQNETDLVYTLDKHIYDSSYVIAFEKQVQTHFVASKNNPLCEKPELPITDLMEQPMILTEKGMSYRKLMEESLASRFFAVHPFLELGDTALICRLVEQNMGISFLPDYVTEHSVKSGKICRLNVKGFSIDSWIQLLYHRDKWCTPEMQCVIDYLFSVHGDNGGF